MATKKTAPSKRFAAQPRVIVPGSEKQSIVAPDSQPLRAFAATAAAPMASGRLTVSVILKPKTPLPASLSAISQRMTRAQFAAAYGPDAGTLRLLRAFAAEYGLALDTKPAGPTTVQLTGTAAALQKAFDVTLTAHKLDDRTYRVREGSISVPEELVGHILAVLGLDNRPQAQSQARVAKALAANTSFTPVQVAALYGFPANARATGQTIAIIELGGGYRTADLTAYFKSLGLPAPTVTAVSVDKGKNSPSTADGADGEVMLDIEVAAAVAPGAKVAVYFAPNTDQGFIDAVSTAIHDTKNKPSVVSISWGGPESTWTTQSLTALDTACRAGAALGVTITCASGDNGSSDGVTTDKLNHVDFPASSPNVLACGGTKLVGTGTTITSEVVWNETAAKEGATGGGVSTFFALPSWQKNAGVPKSSSPTGGRGVPDVAGDADPATGYAVRVDGQNFVIGGTSAVAPLWAGLIALANAQNKVAAGFINPAIYASGAKKAFRDITSGNNGAFSAGPGWDACTGLGSPIGTAVITAIKPANKATAKSVRTKA